MLTTYTHRRHHDLCSVLPRFRFLSVSVHVSWEVVYKIHKSSPFRESHGSRGSECCLLFPVLHSPVFYYSIVFTCSVFRLHSFAYLFHVVSPSCDKVSFVVLCWLFLCLTELYILVPRSFGFLMHACWLLAWTLHSFDEEEPLNKTSEYRASLKSMYIRI